MQEVPQERDAQGDNSGVELEDTTSVSDNIRDPFDPRLIDVTSEVRSLDNLLRRIKAGQIDLDPDFQRSRGIWTNKKKSLLIESLLLRIPLPTFYVSELDAGPGLGESRWAVVDGIQRLSTVAEFVEPSVIGLTPFRLQGLEYLREDEGKTFEELSTSLQLRILESQFTMQVIRRSTPEAVKLNIFARINTGGLPLTAQEMRNALIPGAARSLLQQMAKSKEFQSAVDNSVRGTRMADREMALRYLAFRHEATNDYKEPDFDKFLREATKRINQWSDDDQRAAVYEFLRTMKVCRALFGRDAFRKRYRKSDPRRPVSKALFESVSVSVGRVLDDFGPGSEKHLVLHRDAIMSDFRKLMGDPDFDRSVSQGTGDPTRVRRRFAAMYNLFRGYVESDD